MTDEIIGLEFTNGSVCYCPRSALTSMAAHGGGGGGGYLSARFGMQQHHHHDSHNHIPAGAERIAGTGRKIYYIPRDGTLFANHILPYILEQDAHLPATFGENPSLWRRLRQEALFYALDRLTELLQVTHVCHAKDNPNARGVLYWLGTDKGKSRSYTNPFALGSVHVTGWATEITGPEAAEDGSYAGAYFDLDEIIDGSKPSSLQALVQYRAPIIGVRGVARQRLLANDSAVFPLTPQNKCHLFGFSHGQFRLPATVDLKNVLVRPTAYSLRSSTDCYTTTWNFEASQNGLDWDVLHAARDDHNLKVVPLQDMPVEVKDRIDNTMTDGGVDEVDEFLLEFAEKCYRHTWNVESTKFYRFFRITGTGQGDSTDDLMAVGLELFGDVQEV